MKNTTHTHQIQPHTLILKGKLMLWFCPFLSLEKPSDLKNGLEDKDGVAFLLINDWRTPQGNPKECLFHKHRLRSRRAVCLAVYQSGQALSRCEQGVRWMLPLLNNLEAVRIKAFDHSQRSHRAELPYT